MSSYMTISASSSMIAIPLASGSFDGLSSSCSLSSSSEASITTGIPREATKADPRRDGFVFSSSTSILFPSISLPSLSRSIMPSSQLSLSSSSDALVSAASGNDPSLSTTILWSSSSSNIMAGAQSASSSLHAKVLATIYTADHRYGYLFTDSCYVVRTYFLHLHLLKGHQWRVNHRPKTNRLRTKSFQTPLVYPLFRNEIAKASRGSYAITGYPSCLLKYERYITPALLTGVVLLLFDVEAM